MNEEIKTNTEAIDEMLGTHMKVINKKLKTTDYKYKVEELDASIKFMSEKFEERKEENALLNTTIKDVRLELEAVKVKENENAQYIRSSFLLQLSDITGQGKNENSVAKFLR